MTTRKVALITGITGQDGSYLSEFLLEKGYDPITQIVNYIISEDPTYITNYNGARGLIRKVDRDKLLTVLVKNYFGVE